MSIALLTNNLPIVIPTAIGVAATGGLLGYKYVTRKKEVHPIVQKLSNLLITEFQIKTVKDGIISSGHTFTMKNPVYKSKTNKELEKTIDMITTSKQSNGVIPLPNLFIHGKPGTGKTTAVRYICNRTGISYIKLNTGELQRLIRIGEIFRAMHDLKLIVEQCVAGCYLIADDGELLLIKRKYHHTESPEDSIKGTHWISDELKMQDVLLQRQTAFSDQLLEFIGDEKRKMALAITTNVKPEDFAETIDDAAFSRFTTILIDIPEIDQRKEMLASHMKAIFEDDADTRTYFNKRILEDMAIKTAGFSGRHLVTLLHEIKACVRIERGDIRNEIIDSCILSVRRSVNPELIKQEMAKDLYMSTPGQMAPSVLAQEQTKESTPEVKTHVVSTTPVQDGGKLQHTVQTVTKTAKDYLNMLLVTFRSIACC